MATSQQPRQRRGAKEAMSSITVFQAEPLAYEDYQGNVNLLRSLDLESESTILKETLEGTGIRLKFETATSKNLGNFLSEGNEMLHFSGHGNPVYLFIENEYGGGQTLLVNEDLKAWIRAGGNNLKFVFVAACHSRSAGEAFVGAGVPHVVCSEKDELMLSDVAATIFARDFYRALSNGRTVQQAYDLAIIGVIQAPELPRSCLDPQQEAKKFVLLPEGGSHDISLFPSSSASSISSSSQHLRKSSSHHSLQSPLPLPPENFVGREIEMYTMFRSMILKKTRLVSITGRKGMGKASFAKAAAQYMDKRKMWGDILWVPSPRCSENDSDLCGLLCNVMTICQKHPDHGSFQSDNGYVNASQQIFVELYDCKATIVIDATKFSKQAIQNLSLFLLDLFGRTKQVKAIAVLSQGDVLDPHQPTGFPCNETTVKLLPLGFSSTVYLFGKVCPHAAAANNWSEECILSKYEKHTETTFRILGEGIPAKTVILARGISDTEYEKLVKEGIPIVEADFEEIINNAEKQCNINQQPAGGGKKKRSSFTPEELPELTDLGETVAKLLPVRNQKSVQHRFLPLLRKEGKIYRKRVTSFIRQARKGEKIVTAIDGVHESQKLVEDNSSWVVCGKAAGEFYVLTDKEFHESYDASSQKRIRNSQDPQTNRLRQQGYFEYNSKRYVWGRIVDEDDMKWFRQGADTPDFACFVAPWGETMRVENGDFLVTQYAANGKCNDEIYRVERIVFEFSYANTEKEECGSSYWFWATATAVGFAGVVAVTAFAMRRSRR